MLNYKFLDHTADIAVEVTGSSLEDLFTASAAALHESIVEKHILENRDEKQFSFTEDTVEELLVTFLSELNFLVLTSKWMFNSVREININKNDKWHLDAAISGETFNPAKHILKEEIKAVTYHQMNITNENGIYRTKIIFDI